MSSQLLAESLGHDLRFEIVAVATAADVLPIVATRHPHVALISADLDSGTKKGFQVARSVNSRHPSVHIVMLLETGTQESVTTAFRCGAAGVFCRTDPLPELTTCVAQVGRGEIWVSRNNSHFLLEALRSTPSCGGITAATIDSLSHRELEVAEHVAQGMSNKQIGDRLGLSEHTIKNYLYSIFQKLEVSNRFELLFLLFKECNSQATGRVGVQSGTEIGNSIEAYLKAAEEGVVAAQFVVGLAHLEGYCVEKDRLAAYYWLRMAEENSCTIRHRCSTLVEELRSTVKTDDVDAAEHNVALGVRENKFLKTRLAAEFIHPSVNSEPIDIVRKFPTGSKSKVAS